MTDTENFTGMTDALNDIFNPIAKSEPVDTAHYAFEINTPIFDQLAKESHATAVDKGFWGPPEMMDKYVAKLALVHSEVTEVLEALRKGQGTDKVTEEFADIFIRCFDLYATLVDAGEADPGLQNVVLSKMEANANRPPKHGNRWG